jgi:glutamate synthase (NADPH/NADH) large chain
VVIYSIERKGSIMRYKSIPKKQGLYEPYYEHDACGIGAIINIKGEKSHSIIRDGLKILVNIDHRGARGADPDTGDGAGIILQVPHKFYSKECKNLGTELPGSGKYAVGMFFLNKESEVREPFIKLTEETFKKNGFEIITWRQVPVNTKTLGKLSRETAPYVAQLFLKPSGDIADTLEFERKLFIARKKLENAAGKIRKLPSDFYITSLSPNTVVYKGMLTPQQVDQFYPELTDNDMESAIALVHSRFSTNTFPNWERAHPYRYLVHNGEINTLRGNLNNMFAREKVCRSEVWKEELQSILPVIDINGSDTGMFDNVFEFLRLSGRSLAHVAMMMIPEAWENDENIQKDKKAFYEYHSTIMEPWDGPAAMAFTDGKMVGAVLDRNGLRPARYYITNDDRMILASEVGVLDIPPKDIIYKERLQPGKLFMIDTERGEILSNSILKRTIAVEKPYRQWIDEYMPDINKIKDSPIVHARDGLPVPDMQKAFCYTHEELSKTIQTMAQKAQEPIGSMGSDVPLAVLSQKPQLLYNYFKQLFAQVTNPPIDYIREKIITGTTTHLGSEDNLLEPDENAARRIRIKYPVLNEKEFNKLVYIKEEGFKSAKIPILFKPDSGKVNLKNALNEVTQKAIKRINLGVNLIILSDTEVSSEMAPIPALLAVSNLHHRLIELGLRSKCSIILESGEPREVHHFALLLGYGVDAVYPYLALESIDRLVVKGMMEDISSEKAINNYIYAIIKGLQKIMSKMGISTIQSYKGAQIFEAVGLSEEFIKKYFEGTPSRIEGIGLRTVSIEAEKRHCEAFQKIRNTGSNLEIGGTFRLRSDGEEHMFNPETVFKLQQSCARGDYEMFKNYTSLINEQTQKQLTLRGLFDIRENPLPIEEVEPVENILKRFKTGAMSYGSISKEAHETLAIAMNRIGGKSNSGEGGEDPERFIPLKNGDSKSSAIKQVASGRFGVNMNYLVNAEEIQIKIAQGAKPGEGGHLPGAKVYPWIAEVRGSTPGVGLISPPPHHDIYSIEDLAQLIHDLKNANPKARITVKLVSEVGVGTIAAGVAKCKADVVLISGFDGGTGAAPRTSILHAGLPWELGLAETHQTLVMNDLRSRITIETDGKLMTGRDVVIAAMLGAEEYGFATAPLIILGCLMMRVCNLDTCPVGVATQNPDLRCKFMGNADHILNFMKFVAQEMREYMALLGIRTVDELIGRRDLLKFNKPDTWKSEELDYSSLLWMPGDDYKDTFYCTAKQDHGLSKTKDNRELLNICKNAIETGEKISYETDIRNTDRVVGTTISNAVTVKYGLKGLPENTINLKFRGTSGQSFGAFVTKGITLELEGDSNDYIGKGLAGGKIIVYPDRDSDFRADENILIGNVAFYGATAGEAYINGIAGERFCIRNSGVEAVVEGIGENGLEYMTGGKVTVLGSVGRNFAAGMSGGIAYVYDADGSFDLKCNKEMVVIEYTDSEDKEYILKMLNNHIKYTGSEKAKNILSQLKAGKNKFIKVIPVDYKNMISSINKYIDEGMEPDKAKLEAFKNAVK